MDDSGEHPVRPAGPEDVGSIGRLLHEFNLEFHEPTPPAADVADRFATLLAGGDALVLLVGRGPDGLAVLRFRLAIRTSVLECYLAELYVRPPMRRLGMGGTLMHAALDVARERGADTMDIGVDEQDHDARRLYERLGFSHRSGGPDGPVMYVYERELHPPRR